jgi:sulfur carrier protein
MTPITTQQPAVAFSVTVNGTPHSVRDGITLDALLKRLGQQAEGVATAVNGEFVPRAARATRKLEAGDAVTCFAPIVGG